MKRVLGTSAAVLAIGLALAGCSSSGSSSSTSSSAATSPASLAHACPQVDVIMEGLGNAPTATSLTDAAKSLNALNVSADAKAVIAPLAASLDAAAKAGSSLSDDSPEVEAIKGTSIAFVQACKAAGVTLTPSAAPSAS